MQTKGIRIKPQALILLLLCCLSFAFALHPFYVSVTEVQIDRGERKVKVACKLFIDDIQHELNSQTGLKIDLQKNTAEQQKILENYIVKNLKLNCGNGPVTLSIVGYETEEEAIWCYLEGPVKRIGNKCLVQNSILCRSQPSQMNIVHLLVDGKRISNRMDCNQTSMVITF